MIDTHHERADSSQQEKRTAPLSLYETEATLVRTYGSNTLAFFGLALPNAHFLTPDREGLVNYQLTGNVAIVLGDPICSPERQREVTRTFLAFCRRQHWRVAFYQASSEHLTPYRSLKLRAFKIGEEAIINPQTFTLNGSAMANVRTSCRRAERDGIDISWYEGVPPSNVMRQLEHVSSMWLEQKTGMQGMYASETGFSTGRLDDVTTLAEHAETFVASAMSSPPIQNDLPRFVTGVATTRSGKACAFVTFTPIYGTWIGETPGIGTPDAGPNWGWGLDLMRRVPDAPPGVMDLLLVRAIERFRTRGASIVSVGMVAMADTRQETTSAQQQLTRFVAHRLGLLETRGTLFNFKQKFHPRWESRYLVTNTTLALPLIMMAVFRLRNYSGGSVEKLLSRFKLKSGTSTWRKTFWQFLRYCLVGGANTLSDLLVLNILLWCFPTHDVWTLVVYNSIAYSSGAVTSFFLNKYWTFGKKRRTTRREVGRFFITLCIEILYSNGLLWLAGKILQPFIANVTLWGNASKLVSVVVGTVISYAFMRFWTFANGPQDQPTNEPGNS